MEKGNVGKGIPIGNSVSRGVLLKANHCPTRFTISFFGFCTLGLGSVVLYFGYQIFNWENFRLGGEIWVYLIFMAPLVSGTATLFLKTTSLIKERRSLLKFAEEKLSMTVDDILNIVPKD
ncbi:hypothetical protein KKC45_03405 [Patescibacteria group bacterium]|nr:hypothetical protein [Patescibacteria group bacterium]